ncbi:phage virion morphogenesis protein [Neisseria musculi]|uniref:Phage virion morphogenesis protein n=1 Tax=Neisseria musculi TaxID=1815583 RepID=A0A7H1MCU4_9NEIS|nr:phage virion morphogenesis protein [Neisseria musculi]QNT59459.1 phage virion morphogenesis protein [Neisseria musculi]
MLEISLDASQLEHGLSQLLKNATDTRPVMRAIATEMVSLTEDNFESEGWGGQKWKRSRRVADNGGKTLQLSGRIAAGISTQIGNGFARIGSNKKYAAIHYFGGKIEAEKKLIDTTIAIESLKSGL